MLAKIIERAAALKAGRNAPDAAKQAAAPKAPANAKKPPAARQVLEEDGRRARRPRPHERLPRPRAKAANRHPRKHAHEQSRLHPVQRRRARRRGRVRRLRRAPWHRGSELHLRRPHRCPPPRRARAESRGAAGRRRQPRVRVAADAPPLHRQPARSGRCCRRSGIRSTTARRSTSSASILDDGTVRGGTGWGAEFAKLCNKPLFVFDQEKDGWFAWSGEAWTAAAPRRRSSPTRTSPAPAPATSTTTASGRSKTLITKSFESASARPSSLDGRRRSVSIEPSARCFSSVTLMLRRCVWPPDAARRGRRDTTSPGTRRSSGDSSTRAPARESCRGR